MHSWERPGILKKIFYFWQNNDDALNYLTFQLSVLVLGGGHSHWKVVPGCAAVMIPFFQASRRSLAYQFTINVLLMCPHFQFLEKFNIFSLDLAKILTLKMQSFQISVPKTPHFLRKIHSLDPTFGNPRGTPPPPKKCWVPLSGYWFGSILIKIQAAWIHV